MNSKKCKQLRRMIYGDLSTRPESRKYVTIGHKVSVMIPDPKTGVPSRHKYIANQALNHPDSPRAKYQAAKRQYKARKRG